MKCTRYSENYDYGRMLDFKGLVVQQALIKYRIISKASILPGLFYCVDRDIMATYVSNVATYVDFT